MPCTCSAEYDSDTGANFMVVCDDCQAMAAPCSHNSECVHCFWDIEDFKEYYYQLVTLEGAIFLKNEGTPEELEKELNILTQMCNFVLNKPNFFIAHPEFRAIVVSSFTEFLERPEAKPLHDDFRMALNLITG